MRRRSRAWLAAGLLALAGGAAAQSNAAAQAHVATPANAATADQVKAAYLYRFGAYVEWPPGAFAQPDAPFVLAVIGAERVHTELLALAAGRTVQGHRVIVQHLTPRQTPIEAHLVFLGGDLRDDVAGVLTTLQGRPVLVVTDLIEGIPGGAMLNFVVTTDRVRFEASPAAAEKAGLKMSSRLLTVAVRVVEAP